MPVAVPPTLLCIVRFRAVQRFAAQCSDVLQNATLCTDMLYSAELCTDVLNSAALDRTVPICAAQCSIVKSCATQCCTHCTAMQCCTAQKCAWLCGFLVLTVRGVGDSQSSSCLHRSPLPYPQGCANFFLKLIAW